MNLLARLQLMTVLDQLGREVGIDGAVLFKRWEQRVEGLIAVGVDQAQAESDAYHALVVAERRDAAYRRGR